MARVIAGRSHVPAPRTTAAWQKKWDANGSIAPRMPALCEAFPFEKPQLDKFTFSHAQILDALAREPGFPRGI
jgi:hypothetical protein